MCVCVCVCVCVYVCVCVCKLRRRNNRKVTKIGFNVGKNSGSSHKVIGRRVLSREVEHKNWAQVRTVKPWCLFLRGKMQ